MSNLTSSVWKRTGISEMTRSTYSVLVCVFILIGMAMSAITALFTQGMYFPWWSLLIVLAITIGGSYLSIKAQNPILSFLGYVLIAVPFGAILGPVTAQYTSASIFSVFLVTMVLTIGLGIMGATTKADLSSWFPYLFGGLIVLLCGYFIVPITGLLGLPIKGALSWLDWIGVVLFGFLIVFDWNRAMRIPYTKKNALASAVSIYLDILNIFTRLLGQTGVKKD